MAQSPLLIYCPNGNIYTVDSNQTFDLIEKAILSGQLKGSRIHDKPPPRYIVMPEKAKPQQPTKQFRTRWNGTRYVYEEIKAAT